jgi:hypothetical protein
MLLPLVINSNIGREKNLATRIHKKILEINNMELRQAVIDIFKSTKLMK